MCSLQLIFLSKEALRGERWPKIAERWSGPLDTSDFRNTDRGVDMDPSSPHIHQIGHPPSDHSPQTMRGSLQMFVGRDKWIIDLPHRQM